MGLLGANILNTIDVREVLLTVPDARQETHFDLVFAILRVPIPTDWGGRLSVQLIVGPAPNTHLCIVKPDGSSVEATDIQQAISVDIAEATRDERNYYAVVIAPAGQFSIVAMFVEAGHAREADGRQLIPWNFWYFPFSRDLDPDTSVFNAALWEPLTKYEAAFGVDGVREWEERHHSDHDGKRERWEGHCNTGAMASVLFEEPPALSDPINGIQFTREELKFLAAEFVGEHANLTDFTHLEEGDALYPKKPAQEKAAFAKEPKGLLNTLLTQLRGIIRDQGEPLVMDLRDATGASYQAVWNHAVYKYRTVYWHKDATDLGLVHGRTTLFANLDDCNDQTGASTGLPDDAHCTKRTLLFTLRLTPVSRPDPDSSDHRWTSCLAGTVETFAPRVGALLRTPRKSPRRDLTGNERIRGEHVLQLLKLRGKFHEA